MRWARRKAHGCAGGENDERNFGYSAAHETDPLPLLPSGPGGVRGESLHRARSSTDRQSRKKSHLKDCFAKSSIGISHVKAHARGWNQGIEKAVEPISRATCAEGRRIRTGGARCINFGPR